jgi:hypothetical protein
MKPDLFWKIGERRVAPNGRVLKGRYTESLWTYREKYEGTSRNFFKKVDGIASRLKPHRAFLQKVSATGGKCEMYVQLSGAMNIGDSLRAPTLRLLGELDILLSVEVFPDWKSA